MKSRLLSVVLLLSFFVLFEKAKAQSPGPGNIVLRAGLGIGYNAISIPVSAEFGFADLGGPTLTAGPTGAFGFGDNYTFFQLGGDVRLHYDFDVPKFDTFFGVGAAFGFLSDDYGNDNVEGFGPLVFFGLSYNFSPAVGAYLSAGLQPGSVVNIGLNFNLR